MSFADHKITEFTHRITDLPDQPTLSPQELKARFDSSPEELRKAHNAVCDEGERLSARVEDIVTDTFGDTIDREMLSHELAAELDAKAEQTALEAEAAAREQTDAMLVNRINAVETALPQKCEVVFGTYTGNMQTSMDIFLGFQPAAVLVMAGEGWNSQETYSTAAGFCMPGIPSHDMKITETGFTVYRYLCGKPSPPYRYVAFRPQS